MRLLPVVFLTFSFLQIIQAEWPRNEFEATSYLMRYGYLDPAYTLFVHPKLFYIEAIGKFQLRSGLESTGILDEVTMKQMQNKRCGVLDILPAKRKPLLHISKRFALHGSKWQYTNLTYKIDNYTPDLSKLEIDATIEKALQVWSRVSILSFTRIYVGSADIEVEFRTGDHGDGIPFDGPGQTLAHAFFPNTKITHMSGNVHFDDDEQWVLGNENGTNLLCTAIHEFGHSLGLAHSIQYDAMMWPFDKKCDGGKLSNDDILAIQSLYGPVISTTEQVSNENTVVTIRTREPGIKTTRKPGIKTTRKPGIKTTREPGINTTREPGIKTREPSIKTREPGMKTTREPGIKTREPDIKTSRTEELTTKTSKEPWKTRETFSYPPTTGTTLVPENENICDVIVNALTISMDGTLLIFFDKKVAYWFGEQLIIKQIADIFPDSPDFIDAAFTITLPETYPNDEKTFTMLIKHKKAWKYYYNPQKRVYRLASGYPKLDWVKCCEQQCDEIKAAISMDNSVYIFTETSLGNTYEEMIYTPVNDSFRSVIKSSVNSLPMFMLIPMVEMIDAAVNYPNGIIQIVTGGKLFTVNINSDYIPSKVTCEIALNALFGCNETAQNFLRFNSDLSAFGGLGNKCWFHHDNTSGEYDYSYEDIFSGSFLDFPNISLDKPYDKPHHKPPKRPHFKHHHKKDHKHHKHHKKHEHKHKHHKHHYKDHERSHK